MMPRWTVGSICGFCYPAQTLGFWDFDVVVHFGVVCGF